MSSVESRIVSRTISKTPGELFGKTNPCKVPETSPPDCVVCPAYSAGTFVAVQVECGSRTRTIRRFLPNEGVNWKPPRRDSWMVDLLRDIGYVPGGVRQLFITESEEPQANDSDSRILQEIGAGKYDLLFQGAGDKLSKAYLESKIRNMRQRFRCEASRSSRRDLSCRSILLWREGLASKGMSQSTL